jgi:hypothetical protein
MDYCIYLLEILKENRAPALVVVPGWIDGDDGRDGGECECKGVRASMWW